MIVVNGRSHEQRTVLTETLHLLADELVENRPAAQTAAVRLIDVLIIHAVRAWVATAHTDRSSWPSGRPVDPVIAAALERIHADPARRWTTQGLAAEVGLSRTAFVRRFRALTDVPPSTYTTRWRLAIAARRLRETTDPLAVISREVGYSSEFTFSRAFTRLYGHPPGRYRTRP